jgi:phosphate transport system permease protein
MTKLTQHQRYSRLRKRRAAERRFRLYGILAILLSLSFLGLLLTSIIGNGYTAFAQTNIKLSVTFDGTNSMTMLNNALETRFPEVTERKDKKLLLMLLSKSASYTLDDTRTKHPEWEGSTQAVWLPASSDVDMFVKGHMSADVDESLRKIKDIQVGWLESLKAEGALEKHFNTAFFVSADSRSPEMAGILGSLIGSLFTVLTCIAVSLPIAVMTAVYLEEFARKNRFTDLIEVNINNLAAVPSIVFGLLGLAIFLSVFGMPRSSALVGGITLSLMVLPTIVITTRNALKAVPPSIRDGAMALGASRIQVLFHHTLPLAMPGIMTGTILGIARALGETAPLLMIGMVAFIADVPKGILDPATTLPVQIFLWADSPEMGFIERTSAAIMILLAFLITANTLAVWLRKKYETRW